MNANNEDKSRLCPICEKEMSVETVKCPACGSDLIFLDEIDEVANNLCRIAEAERIAGNNDRALLYYRLGLECDADDPALVKQCARSLEEYDDPLLATSYWQRYLVLQPHDQQALAALADNRRKTRRPPFLSTFKLVTFAFTLFILGGVLSYIFFATGAQPPAGNVVNVEPSENKDALTLQAVKISSKPGSTISKTAKMPPQQSHDSKGKDKNAYTLYKDKLNKKQKEINLLKNQLQQSRQEVFQYRQRTKAFAQYVQQLSKIVPASLQLTPKYGGIKVTGKLDYVWDKTAIEDLSQQWDCEFVDLSGVRVTKKDMVRYRIKNGDSLFLISRIFGGGNAGWKDIFILNQDRINDPDKLKVGQEIVIRLTK